MRKYFSVLVLIILLHNSLISECNADNCCETRVERNRFKSLDSVMKNIGMEKEAFVEEVVCL